MKIFDIWRTAINPEYKGHEIIGFNNSLHIVGKAIVVSFSLSLIPVIFIAFFKQKGYIPTQSTFDKTIFNFILISFIGPILEELIFRGVLIKNKISWSISIILGLFFLFKRIGIEWYGSLIILIFICFIGFFYKRSLTNKLYLIFYQNFKLVFYSSIVLFALIHIDNYNFENSIQYLTIPLIVFSQFLTAIVLSYLVVSYKYGLLYSILTHMAINTFCALPLLIR